jgi:hypothetical protein
MTKDDAATIAHMLRRNVTDPVQRRAFYRDMLEWLDKEHYAPSEAIGADPAMDAEILRAVERGLRDYKDRSIARAEKAAADLAAIEAEYRRLLNP